jgi:hypothetical protein
MGFFIHGQTKDIGTKRLIALMCRDHQINPELVHTIEMSGVEEEPRYRIEFFNKDGNFCTIEVQGEFPEENKPKGRGKK